MPLLPNFIPEPILFISYLDRLSNYLHFGMLDKPSICLVSIQFQKKFSKKSNFGPLYEALDPYYPPN